MKRLLDIVISVVVLLVFLPLGLLIAVAILGADPGPIFYRQERVGQNGKKILCGNSEPCRYIKLPQADRLPMEQETQELRRLVIIYGCLN